MTIYPLNAPTRELARRRSGTDDVLLLWYPETDWVALSIRDVTTGAGYDLEVAPENALDAFYHPYVYVSSSENSDRVARARVSTVAPAKGEA